MLMLGALFVQWFAHSQREARREDRRLDRLEARAQRARLRPWGHAITKTRHATIRPGPARRPRLRCDRPVPEDNLEMINERDEDPRADEVLTILLYASDRPTRENVRLALGRKVAADLPPVRVLEVATQPAVLTAMDAGGIDLAILDGEAVPGGMGLCRQLKDEIFRCPPILVLTGRPDDAWLATWSRADGVVPHPVDPIRLPAVVAALLRPRGD